MRKMQRHLALPLRTNESEGNNSEIPDVTSQLAESILNQGHLCPVPLTARPLIWELDYTMRLFPLPHLVSPKYFFCLPFF